MSNPREERSASPYESDSSPRRHRWRSRTRSPPIVRSRSRSKSKSKSMSPPMVRSRSPVIPRRSRSRSVDASNPGNNLYITGLSTRVSASELEECFAKHGKVSNCHLVTDPRTNESRGFGFITMETREDADRCIKHLHRSVLEGRLITVEKAKRSRGRTPTPGRYQGQREKQGGRDVRRRSHSFSPQRRYGRGPYPYTRDRRGRSRSPYGSRRANNYPRDSYRRHRERSLSPRGYSYR